jgi:hypothetical protein
MTGKSELGKIYFWIDAFADPENFLSQTERQAYEKSPYYDGDKHGYTPDDFSEQYRECQKWYIGIWMQVYGALWTQALAPQALKALQENFPDLFPKNANSSAASGTVENSSNTKFL